MFTFDTATNLHAKFVQFHEAGKVAAALCHGVAILKYARLTGGEPLVAGRTVTGFANVEEDFSDQSVWDSGALPDGVHVMPWRIEDELKALGANYIQAGLWKGFAVRDGNLITGQQNFSGSETAALIIEAWDVEPVRSRQSAQGHAGRVHPAGPTARRLRNRRDDPGGGAAGRHTVRACMRRQGRVLDVPALRGRRLASMHRANTQGARDRRKAPFH
jgi:hypothetical protein